MGSFDRYQYGLLCFVWLTTYVCGLNYYNQIFIFSSPPHREGSFVPIFSLKGDPNFGHGQPFVKCFFLFHRLVVGYYRVRR